MTTVATPAPTANQTLGSPAAQPNAAQSVQLVACQCAGHQFALGTDYLNGVHQLSRQQVEEGVDRLETTEGEYPIISLASLLSDRLGVTLADTPDDRALLAVQVEDQRIALRTGTVSRPMMTDPNAFYQLPTIAHPGDTSGIFQSIAVIDPDAENPTDALRLLFNPGVALGLVDGQRNQPAATKQIGGLGESTGGSITGDAGQLLAFMPEDATGHSFNFIFALPISVIAEVTTAHPVMPLGIASENLEGYIYWRKRPVPVVRLGKSFGIDGDDATSSATAKGGRRLVVARTVGERWVAFYTQTQMHSIRVPSAEAISPPSLRNCPTLGAFKTESGILVVPDLAQILDGTV